MAVLVVACAACVVLFLPANLGGAATYVTTRGTSMEPKFHTGDLAIVKPVNRYRVGDIAVYRSDSLHTLVMHRIIGRDGNRYVFKGDHNSWTDRDRPARADLVGKLWLEVPHGGTALDVVHRNWMFVLAAALLLLFGTSGFAVRRSRRRRREARSIAAAVSVSTTTKRRRTRSRRRGKPRAKTARAHRSRRSRHRRRSRAVTTHTTSGRRHRGGASSRPTTRATRRGSKRMRRLGAIQLVSGAALVVCLAGGAFVWSRSPTDVGITPVGYRNQGAFTYTAPVPEGPVYGTRGLQTGDPVYLRLVSQLDVGFAYHLLTNAPHRASGTVALRADVHDATGWHESIELTPATGFLNGVAQLHATLDLAQIQAEVAAAAGATGVRSTTATVAVVADVHVGGRVARLAFTDTFAPELTFQLDPLVMRLTGASTPASGAGSSSASDALRPVTHGAVTLAHGRRAAVGVFGLNVDVAIARWVALGGAVLSALVLLVVSLMLRPLRRNEVALIDARDGHMIVPVAASEPGTQRVATIDVTSMSDLVRLAERYDRLILHHARDGAHVYLFEADGIAYRYSIRDVPTDAGARRAVSGAA
jgi:signal peptidase I